MNTDALAKHYHTFSPAERLSLILAAVARCDEVEHKRLADAAPQVTFRVSHTFGRAMAFLTVASLHRMDQLNLAALFFKTAGLAEGASGQLAAQCHSGARLYGYLVNIYAEAWSRFCERERLNDAIYARTAAGEMTLAQAAQEARLIGFTEEEARAYARSEGKISPDHLKTVELVVRDLQATYRHLIARWE